MKFFITIFVHSPYPRIVVLHAFLFLSNQFIKNCTEISKIVKELQDTPVTKLFRFAKSSNWI